MANEKKPSIYVDRGTIGSSDELDEYGVWVKSEPQDLSSVIAKAQEVSAGSPAIVDMDLTIPEIEDLPEFDSSSAAAPELSDNEFDLPDTDQPLADEEDDGNVFNFGDLTNIPESFGEKPEEDMPTVEAEGAGNEGLTEVSMDDFIGSLDTETESSAETEELEPSISLEPMPVDSPESFDSFVEKSEVKPAEIQPDLSTQLLMKIADELSSIRAELSTLKKEFSSIKVAPAQTKSDEKGFISEEDDDKIALTGAELINIMNSADFTEEAGVDATMELSEIPPDTQGAQEADTVEPAAVDETLNLDMDISLDETNLDDLEGETESADTAFTDFDISLDEDILPLGEESTEVPELSLEEEAIPDLSGEESDELKAIRESGAEPMTPAPLPEDADYLTEDPLAQEPFAEADFGAEDTIDLSEAIIDEPDLSSGIQDTPPEEPSLEDISIDLDLSALESGESDSDENVLDIDSEEEEAPLSLETENTEEGGDLSLIPEGFVVEPESDSDDSHASDDLSEDLSEDLSDDLSVDLSGVSGEDISEEDLDTFVTESDDTTGEIAETEEADIAQVTEDVSDSQDTLKPADTGEIPSQLKMELKTVLSYMDQLLESLPDEKIEEFAQSKYYDTYKKLFRELGLV